MFAFAYTDRSFTGDHLTYTYWANNEPSTDDNEACTAAYWDWPGHQEIGEWHDIPCNQNCKVINYNFYSCVKHFICEEGKQKQHKRSLE